MHSSHLLTSCLENLSGADSRTGDCILMVILQQKTKAIDAYDNYPPIKNKLKKGKKIQGLNALSLLEVSTLLIHQELLRNLLT